MHDDLAQLHIDTYNSVADEYEERVEIQKPVTKYALSNLIKQLKPKAKVLDIGCAVGYTVEIFRQADMVVEGIDIAPAMIEYACKRNPTSKLIVSDFLDVQYPTDTYDAVLMYAFLHLFPREIAMKCLDKVIEILKPGGYIFIGTTKSNESSEGFEHKADYKIQVKRFRKRWTPEELEAAFTSKGLETIYQEDISDEFGKIWMVYLLRTVVQSPLKPLL